ncbi:hypothetical protein [Paracoccus tegillarcae]|nr:hypothetical protein [Paracoccus tegillarcae]
MKIDSPLGLKGNLFPSMLQRNPTTGAGRICSRLALSRYRNTGDLLKQITEAANDPASYADKIKDLASRIDAGKKEALAEYVIHRKSIIELLDAARKFDDAKTRGAEDEVHSLIFRRFSDSVNVEYFQHNLG